MTDHDELLDKLAQRETLIVDLIKQNNELQEQILNTSNNHKKIAANAVMQYENYLSSFPVTAQEFAGLIMDEEIDLD